MPSGMMNSFASIIVAAIIALSSTNCTASTGHEPTTPTSANAGRSAVK